MKRSLPALASLFSSIVLVACASTPKAELAPNQCAWRISSGMRSTAGMQILSVTTQAMYSVGNVAGKGHGYVLLARGQPDWFVGKLVGGGGHVNGVGPRDHVWDIGSRSVKLIYDPATNSANIFGKQLKLDTANVLLVDRVDGVFGEPHLVGTACIHEFDTDNPDSSLRAAIPSVQTYIRARPDA
jgi:hypothetical protein